MALKKARTVNIQVKDLTSTHTSSVESTLDDSFEYPRVGSSPYVQYNVSSLGTLELLANIIFGWLSDVLFYKGNLLRARACILRMARIFGRR